MKAIKTLALVAAISFASVTAYAGGGCCASKAKASADGAKADAAQVVKVSNVASADSKAECSDAVAKAECSSEKKAACSDADKKQCDASNAKASASAEKPSSSKDDN